MDKIQKCYGYMETYDPDTGDRDRKYYESNAGVCDHDDCDPDPVEEV